MKNVFGILMNKNDDSSDVDGKVFRVNQIIGEHKTELDSNNEELDKLEEKSSLPTIFIIIEYISFFIALTCFASIISSDVPLKTAYQNAPYIFYIAGSCLIISVIIFIINKYKSKKIYNSTEYKDIIEDIEENINTSKEILGISDDAQLIDVFTFVYKINKKGKTVIKTSKLFQYINLPLYVYKKDDKICFANAYEEFAIPLSSLVEIKKINKSVFVYGWNKDEPYNEEKYKKYKIHENNLGTLIIKPYYSLIINDPIGDFEIFIPCYDIDEIVRLTGVEIVGEKE